MANDELERRQELSLQAYHIVDVGAYGAWKGWDTEAGKPACS